ncbi:oligosaccharide flippase family protein [Sphingomonas abietis]|uniref:Oligosaccharide flippase family protein n=1 Tax=Sphingomonas abietis TaxID=3012344 RepID=A0ABY7NIL7_9SPHN|nr:oligosaccharide flippase family protein [Sphingomonas abietis]WBO20840.1 oligosaccharide flippase family protein [Sphingomonas abietis]
MSFARVALSGSAWSLGQMLVERGLQASLFFIVAKLLGPAEFGIAAIAISLPMVFVATLYGTVQVIIQREEASDDFLATAFWFAIGLGVVFSLITIALSPLIAHLIKAPNLVSYMVPAAFAPLATSLGVVGEGVLTRKFQFRMLAIRRTAGLFGSAPFCILLAFAGYGPWSLIANTLLTSLISSSVALFGSGFRPRFFVDRAELRAFARMASYTSLAQASVQANTRLADLAIGIFAGPATAGTFRIARTIIDLVISVIYQPFTSVLMPIFSRLATDPQRAAGILAQIMFISCVVLSFPFLALFASAEAVSATFVSHAWIALGPLLAWMAVAYPTNAVIGSSQTFSISQGWVRMGLILTVVDLVPNMIFLSIGATHGPVVLGIMFSLRAYVVAVVVLAILTRADPTMAPRRFVKALLPCYLALAVGAGVLVIKMLLPSVRSGLVPGVLLGVVASLVYAGMVFWLCRRQLHSVIGTLPLPARVRGAVDRYMLLGMQASG